MCVVVDHGSKSEFFNENCIYFLSHFDTDDNPFEAYELCKWNFVDDEACVVKEMEKAWGWSTGFWIEPKLYTQAF